MKIFLNSFFCILTLASTPSYSQMATFFPFEYVEPNNISALNLPPKIESVVLGFSNSIVQIQTESVKGFFWGSAALFKIDGKLKVVTAKHVIQYPGFPFPSQVLMRVNEKIIEFSPQSISMDPLKDLAFFDISLANEVHFKDMKPLEFASNETLRTGLVTINMGFPLNIAKRISAGHLYVDFTGSFASTARSNEGSSGGVQLVFDENNQYLGVAGINKQIFGVSESYLLRKLSNNDYYSAPLSLVNQLSKALRTSTTPLDDLLSNHVPKVQHPGDQIHLEKERLENARLFMKSDFKKLSEQTELLVKACKESIRQCQDQIKRYDEDLATSVHTQDPAHDSPFINVNIDTLTKKQSKEIVRQIATLKGSFEKEFTKSINRTEALISSFQSAKSADAFLYLYPSYEKNFNEIFLSACNQLERF